MRIRSCATESRLEQDYRIDVSDFAVKRDVVSGLQIMDAIEARLANFDPSHATHAAFHLFNSRSPGSIQIEGKTFLPQHNISLFVHANLYCDDFFAIENGSLEIAGSLIGTNILAGSIHAERYILAEALIAKSAVVSGGSITIPMGSRLHVTDKNGIVEAKVLDVGNLIADKVLCHGRVSVRGGILKCDTFTSEGLLHIGRGKDGDVRGAVIYQLSAGGLDSDASIVVEHAQISGAVFIAGDFIVGTKLDLKGVSNSLITGSLAAKRVQSQSRIFAAYDPREKVVGIPRVFVGAAKDAASGYIKPPDGKQIEPYDEAAVRILAGRIKYPVLDYILSLGGDQVGVRIVADPSPIEAVNMASSSTTNTIGSGL